MSDVLWTDIDNYLLTNLLADMGTGGLYSTLVVNEVLLSDSFKPEKYSPPAIVIFSNNAKPIMQDEHGDGLIHIFSEYRYFIAAVDAEQTTYAVAKANAQALVQRLRIFALSHYALSGIASTPGDYYEAVEYVTMQDMRVEVMGGNVGGKFRGVGVMPLTVRARI